MSDSAGTVAKVQIAGVHDVEEARIVAEAGAEWIGLPLRLDVHAEDLSEAEARQLVASCHDLDAAFVLITYLADGREIAGFARYLGLSRVQVHGPIEISEIRRLRERLPEVFVIKSLVIRTGNEDALREDIVTFAPHVDAFITDTYDPSTGASGATGKVHDWTVSQRLVALSPKPVIFAGGLNPSNVREAILTVRPAGVDAHTGVENATGRKDQEAVREFVSEAREAFAEMESHE